MAQRRDFSTSTRDLLISLTGYLKLPTVRATWRTCLPGTTSCVSSINKAFKKELVIPPSRWVALEKRYTSIGNAYDYLVGVLFGGNHSLKSPLSRVQTAVAGSPELQRTFALLLELLKAELPNIKGRKWENNTGFLRCLGALADLDVMFRALVPPPEWSYSSKIHNVAKLRAQLRASYPDEFIQELKDLARATIADLPRGETIIYNPVFGGVTLGQIRPGFRGGFRFGADGDLIIDDLLLELKVSVKPLKYDYLWQLLGYAALNRLNGTNGIKGIKRIGVYNPRYRVLWSAALDDLIEDMGVKSFDAFFRWFRNDAVKAVKVKEIFSDTLKTVKTFEKASRARNRKKNVWRDQDLES